MECGKESRAFFGEIPRERLQLGRLRTAGRLGGVEEAPSMIIIVFYTQQSQEAMTNSLILQNQSMSNSLKLGCSFSFFFNHAGAVLMVFLTEFLKDPSSSRL